MHPYFVLHFRKKKKRKKSRKQGKWVGKARVKKSWFGYTQQGWIMDHLLWKVKQCTAIHNQWILLAVSHCKIMDIVSHPQLPALWLQQSHVDKFRVWEWGILKQRIPCIIRISIFRAFSAEKKGALYMGKYGIALLTLSDFTYKSNGQS